MELLPAPGISLQGIVKSTIRTFVCLSAASISIIVVVGLHLFTSSIGQWQGIAILAVCFALILYFKKLSTVVVILIASVGGFLLLQL
jgi:chromate transporter